MNNILGIKECNSPVNYKEVDEQSEFFFHVKVAGPAHVELYWLKYRKYSVEVRQHGTGMTAIQFATELGKEDMVKLFLKYNADFHVTDCEGKTPLDVALQKQEELCLASTTLLGQPTVENYAAIVRLLIAAQLQESTRRNVYFFLLNNEEWGKMKTKIHGNNENKM